ncbi:MAG: DUF4281 domain-containing protein [Bryobacteraceae bacterium]|nr:DUF4281 domain-containing protein [Bryobacteraceae bacterium]
MNAARLFEIVSTLVLPGWLLLVLAPRWRFTQAIAGVGLPLVLAGTYVSQLVMHWGESEGGFGSLADVSKLFANPNVLLAGWIHYLAFDLFIGAWEVRDAARQQVPHWFVVPCLVLTFLYGPTGLLLYFAIRYARERYHRA